MSVVAKFGNVVKPGSRDFVIEDGYAPPMRGKSPTCRHTNRQELPGSKTPYLLVSHLTASQRLAAHQHGPAMAIDELS